MTKNHMAKFSSKEVIRRYLSLTITLWVGVTLSIIAFVSVLQNNMEDIKGEFFYESKLQTESLKNDLIAYQRSLELVRSFFESSDYVTEKEFKHLIKPLFDKGNFSNILWVENTNGEMNYHAKYCATKDGYQHFSEISPSMSLANYSEIISAMKQVSKTKKPALSKNIKFLSSNPHNLALLYPVIKSGNVLGQVIGILDLDKVMLKNFTIGEKNLKELFIYNEDKLMFSAKKGKIQFNGDFSAKNSPRNIINKSMFNYAEDLNILSKKWKIIFVPSSKYLDTSESWYPWIILILGITITAIIALFLFKIIGQNIEIAEGIKHATEDLEHSKQHIQSILNGVMEGIITINSRGIIQTFNPAAEKMFGYTQEEVIGQNVKMLMDGEHKKNHHTYIENYLNTGDAKIIGIGREVEARRKNGDMFPMGLGITATELDGEKIFVGIVRDITAEKESQRRIEEARANAEKANNAKSEFLATMSHEIRTPMNGIIGVAELMSYTPINEKQEQYINTIQSSGELLLSLINDVLDFSKMESGEFEFESIPVVLNGLAEEVMNLLNSKSHEKNVELVVRIPQNVPLAVTSDPVRLRQILINLIGNAIKFTKDGHVLLNIEKVSQKNDMVVLKFEVKDTGVGIPEDKLPIIFEQFCQADSSTTREFGGTGLGLTICKKLISMMGGNIQVDSVPGKGSNFWFEVTLPVARDYTEIDISMSQKLRNKRIMIVDDCKINLEVLSEYLNHIGIDCDVAPSTDIMFDYVKKAKSEGKPYDILVVDYYMPSINGIEAGQVISNNEEIYGNPALVFLTSLDRRFDSEHLEDSGFSGYLIKPVYPHMLVRTLIAAMEKHSEKTDSSTSQNPPDDAFKIKGQRELPSFKVNILVVEDFKANQEVIEDMLQQLGCSVTIADNGKHAIEVFKENHEEIDIIMMDCQMPEMDGFEATREIRKLEEGKKVPIISLTANALQGDKEKCLESGMDDYMSKPVKIKDLVKMLCKYSKKSDAA